MNEELKIELGINEWLKLIKEDKNLNNTFINICQYIYLQYIYLTEKENQELKNNWNKLKEIMEEETREYWNTNILEIMQKIEGSDSNGIK